MQNTTRAAAPAELRRTITFFTSSSFLQQAEKHARAVCPDLWYKMKDTIIAVRPRLAEAGGDGSGRRPSSSRPQKQKIDTKAVSAGRAVGAALAGIIFFGVLIAVSMRPGGPGVLRSKTEKISALNVSSAARRLLTRLCKPPHGLLDAPATSRSLVQPTFPAFARQWQRWTARRRCLLWRRRSRSRGGPASSLCCPQATRPRCSASAPRCMTSWSWTTAGAAVAEAVAFCACAVDAPALCLRSAPPGAAGADASPHCWHAAPGWTATSACSRTKPTA